MDIIIHVAFSYFFLQFLGHNCTLFKIICLTLHAISIKRITKANYNIFHSNNNMRKVRYLTIALLCTVVQASWAWTGNGTTTDPYQIRNSADWATLASEVAAGNVAAGTAFQLMGDISINTSVGTEGNRFQGNFDGGGHTITANLSVTSDLTAPFAYVTSANISHLHVDGTIHGGPHTAGIAGSVMGTSTITDCHVSAKITTFSNDGHIIAGGIVGHGNSTTLTVEGCLFDGSISTTETGVSWCYAGAIVGWCNSSVGITVKNCIENATYANITHAGMNYVYGSANNISTFASVNSYTLAHSWGEVKHGYKVIYLSDTFEPYYAENTYDTYSTTGIEASDVVGLKLDGTFYAGSGERVLINFNHYWNTGLIGYNYSVPSSSIEVSGGDHLLTMPADDVYMAVVHEFKGQGDANDPYLIENEGDWLQFASNIAGYNYNDKHYLLTDDIDIHVRAGYVLDGYDQCFSGTFDGGGHTITAYLSGGDYTCPFYKLNGGTIKNLHVDGEIIGGIHSSGLVGGIISNENQNLIENCRVSATINCTSTHAGGFVGHASTSNTTLRGCLFDGYIKGSSLNYIGYLIGWCTNATNIILQDCAAYRYDQPQNFGATGCKSDLVWDQTGTATCGSVSNSYGGAAGKNLVSLHNGNPAVRLVYKYQGEGDPVTYSTSHLTSYGTGLLFDDVFLLAKDDAHNFQAEVLEEGLSLLNYTVNDESVKLDVTTGGWYNIDFQNTINNSFTINTVLTADELQGEGTDASPYLITRSADWSRLAMDVASGNTYAGKVFRLTKDINCDCSVGTDEYPFSGIFDGDGHTLTLNTGSRYNFVSTRIAPFHRVSAGSTIRHLHTAGKIYSSAQYSGGIISQVLGGSGTTRLYDCHSSMTIVSNRNGDASNGGLVGAASNADSLVIERCSFTGNLHKQFYEAINCGGFVGWSNVPVTIRESLFDPDDLSFADLITTGATFARMASGVNLTLQDCYTTFNFNGSTQGTFVVDELYAPEGGSYEFIGEPDVTFNGRAYYKNGCWIRTYLDANIAFDHWQDGVSGCFISDPWTRNGLHQLKDLSHKPSLSVLTKAIPEAETERTLWGVKYRYLSRRDYHFYISDEDREAKGWTFENNDNDANMIVKDSNNDASEITAVVGYDESDSDFLVTADGVKGVQIHNDLVGDWRAHTHLGVIAPHAFRNSTKLEKLYFIDTDANNYNALLPFDFLIDQGAFENCANFKEMMLMQYTTRGNNHWEGLTPGQIFRVADDAFAGCTKLRLTVRADHYQDYLSSAIWKKHQSRFLPYEATDADFTVKGVKYRWYRDVATEDNDGVKNDEAGKADMMQRLILWNGMYQQFNAASLLDTKDDCNVYYASVVGVDDDDIADENGVMKIYNDPGSYWNYKTITLNRDAIAGNTSVWAIEFWQTNGRSENSYSDLKFVIPNGAFQGCSNLRELRLFYYVQDGTDRWMALGPKDVIPGDNLFGLATADELAEMTEAQRVAQNALRPTDFKILVSTELYPDFKNDPNWQPYLAYIEPVDYSPGTSRTAFTNGGLTYDYMTSPGGIMQTSQVVSQDVSWWTAPRIAIEVALAAYTIGSFISNQGVVQSTETAFGETLTAFIDASQDVTGQQAIVQAAESQAANIAGASSRETIIDVVSRYAATEGAKASMENVVSNFTFSELVRMGVVDQATGELIATSGILGRLTTGELAMVQTAVYQFARQQVAYEATKLATQQALLKSAEQAYRTILLKRAIASKMTYALRGLKALRYAISPAAAATSTAGLISSKCWGGSGSYNADAMNKGMRENILSNIHQVGLVGGGYVITTPQKNLVYHTYIKSVSDATTDAVIYAGFDNDNNSNTSNRTMTFMPNTFKNKTNLRSVKFHDISNQSSNTGMAFLFTIPDEAFTGCTGLTEFSTLLQTDDNGTRALGPENFILGGDSIFAGLDPETFHIVIDPLRKDDFLENESWKPLEKYFTYQSAQPAAKYNEYGAQYAYAYEQNSIKKEHKENGHLIEHTLVVGADNDFITGHQGAVKLCNDIGTYNNYQLDEVMAEAFKDNKNLRSVSFVDLLGFSMFGDCYTDLKVHIGDRAFQGCSNLADLDLLYMVTDGTNHIEPMTPQMISIGKDVFKDSPARIKMMPQQVAWFEADESWAEYKDRFMPCVIRFSDPFMKIALKDMAYYDPANTGTDPALWDDYLDMARIAGAGFSWLDGKFKGNGKYIHSFAEFKYFESVGLDYVGASWFEGCIYLGNIVLPSTIKRIEEKAFSGCQYLTEIELPASVTTIGSNAFSGAGLLTIVVKGETPATLGTDAFTKRTFLKIYVPAAKVDEYKAAWSEYADFIVGDDTYKVNKVVTVTAPGQLAGKLGLTLRKEDSKVRFIDGPYAKYDSLTVIGPLNGEDVAVLRHLMGANAWDSDFTDGQLRYLNLWDADLRQDDTNSYNGWGVDEYLEKDNWVGEYMFHNCNALETVILPKSVTEIGENTFQEAYGLKRIAVGRNTTKYTRDLLQDLTGIEELVFLTNSHATSDSSDPWEAPIQQVYTLPSQLGDYMGDTNLTRQAQDITSPFSTDEVMWALADKGHFFPSEYLQLESVENIFTDNTTIKDFDEFYLFQNVKELEYAFSGMRNLETITLPSSIERIGANAFAACPKLKTIHVSSVKVIQPETSEGDEGGNSNGEGGSEGNQTAQENQPEFFLPELAQDAFEDLPADFQILVPKEYCKLYRERWAQYADHINPDKTDYADAEIITVTVTEPNTLAAALGLTVTTEWATAQGGYYVNSLRGDYSKIYKLKVIGPISGGDLDVLRYLAGYCPWAGTRNYSGHLEYIDLYDAQLKATDVGVVGYEKNSQSFYLAENFRLYKVVRDNYLPRHAFLRAYNLKTLILPRTCTEVVERALQECEGLETLVLGDDMTSFNWNALDDDAMLTRMYILATQKINITKDWAVWNALCNNYSPTFDAFYVRPSLYQQYITDEAYTVDGQKTNNISTGEFTDDESFAVFGAHAAATIDDLTEVYSVNGWFDSHTGVRDLTALGYAAIDELRAEDIQKLTQLEKVVLPVTLTTLEDSVFSKSPNLRYVDMLMCDSTLLIDEIRAHGFATLGIDSLKTLVYVPSNFGTTEGTNIVVADGSGFSTKTFRMVDDKDYCVPYAFTAGKVENTRRVIGKGKPYTVFLPYELTFNPAMAKVYKPTDREGSIVTFEQVADGKVEALKPYVIRPTGRQVSLNTNEERSIPASSGYLGSLSENQWQLPGYAMRGTLSRIDNKEAAERQLMMLVGETWTTVPANNNNAYIAPFRAYILQSGNSGNGARELSMSFWDDEATAIDTIRTIDSDGTERYYDLNGRELPGKPEKGIYIINGKKHINK